MNKYFFIAVLSFLVLPNFVFAHPGNTDALGCHTCRTNCTKWGLDTGEYHCHRSKGVAQPIEPVRSVKNDDGVGTTIPAPEYKQPIPVPKTTTQNQPLSSIATPASQAKPVEPSVQKIEKQSWFMRFLNWVF